MSEQIHEDFIYTAAEYQRDLIGVLRWRKRRPHMYLQAEDPEMLIDFDNDAGVQTMFYFKAKHVEHTLALANYLYFASVSGVISERAGSLAALGLVKYSPDMESCEADPTLVSGLVNARLMLEGHDQSQEIFLHEDDVQQAISQAVPHRNS
jgi:hypothetical protein